MKNKGNLYEIIPNFFLVLVIFVCVIFLIFFGINNLNTKEKITEEIIKQNNYKNIVDKVTYCYDYPINIEKINLNPNCVKLLENNGISINIYESELCNFTHITNFPYRGSGIVKNYAIPIMINNKTCFGKITYYEQAYLVPLITYANVTPIINFVDQETIVYYHIFSSKNPIYVQGEIFNSSNKKVHTLNSGEMNDIESNNLVINPSTLNAGKYGLKLKTTHDLNFFAIYEKSIYFRLINSSTTSTLNDVKVNPRNGTIYNRYNITLNLTDYVNITKVEIAIMNGTDVEFLMECNRTKDYFDRQDISYNYIYSCFWYPLDLPNKNETYNITVTVENELGNILTVNNADHIDIIEQDEFDLIIVSIKSGLEEVYSQSAITALENKVEEYFLTLGQYQDLFGRLFYLDEEEVQFLTGYILDEGDRTDYNSVNAVLTKLTEELKPSYIMILGSDQIFPHGILPSATSGTDDIYGDNNSDNIPDTPVGRVVDPIQGDMNLLIKQFDNFIQVHSSGGLDFSSYAANGMNEPWTSATCYNKHVWGSKTNTYAKIGSFPCDLSDANNKGFYMHLMHGSDLPQVYVCAGWECSCTSPISSSVISFNPAQDSVWFTMSCYGGKTANKQTTSDSIPMTFFSKGGAIYVGSTDLNYGGKNADCFNEAGSLLGDIYVGALYTKITNYFSEETRIGDAYIKGKAEYYFNVDPSGAHHNYQAHINILYGDPTLKIKNMW